MAFASPGVADRGKTGRAGQASAPASTKVANGALDERVPDQVIVKFKSGVSSADVLATVREGGASVVSKSRSGLMLTRVQKGQTPERVAARLRLDPSVAYAEPNYRVRKSVIPDDPSYDSQWGPQMMGCGTAWDTANGAGAVVAVIDTGVDYNHPDLDGKIIKGYDFVNDDPDPMDDEGHGTHVAGIIAAASNNATGVAGVGWDAKVLAIKVLDEYGSGDYYSIARAIRYAADSDAKILNLSLGGYGSSQALNDAVTYARGKGAVVIAAAGNDNTILPSYPAASPGVVSVAATKNTVTYEETSAVLTGSWITWSNPGNSGGQLKWSETLGSSMTFTFTGTGFTMIGFLDDLSAKGNVYVDGGYVGKADFNATNHGYPGDEVFRFPVFTTAGLASGSHTVKIEVEAAGGDINIDAIEVDQSTEARAGFSNYGSTIDVAAPGQNILSTVPGGAYDWYSGTSMASPMVAGVAALISARFPTMTGDQIARHLMETGVDLGTAGRDNLYGHGRVDAAAAVESVNNSVEESSARIEYQGTWADVADARAGGGAVKTSSTASATASFTAYGRSVTWVARKGPSAGIAAVELDGVSQGNVDLYSAADDWQTLSFSKRWEAEGTHTVTITVTGTKNAASSGQAVTLDAFDTGIVDSAAPSVPAGLSATRVGGTHRLQWSGSTDDLGVLGYRLERATSLAGPWSEISTGSSTVYSDRQLASNTPYYYRVKALDTSRNESNYSSVVYMRSLAVASALLQESSPYAAWPGLSWQIGASAVYSGGMVKYTSAPGDAMQFSFRGTSVSWIGSKRADRGTANVYLDGAFQGTIDQYASTPAYRQTIWSKSGLSDTAHNLLIVATGTSRPEASASITDVDGVSVRGYSAGANLEQTTSSAAWASRWGTSGGTLYSAGSVKYSSTAGASVTLTFKGTSVAWIGTRAKNKGIAKVYIDGVLQRSVDQYASATALQQVLYNKSGLRSGTHKLKIVITGTKRAASTGRGIDIDAFVVK